MILTGLMLIMGLGQSPTSAPAESARPGHLVRHKLKDLVLKPRREDPSLFDSHAVECPMVLRWRNRWHMYYTGIRLNNGQADSTLGLAVSDDLIHWKDRRQIMGRGEPGKFDHGGISGPFVWVEGDRLMMIYGGFPKLGYESKPGKKGLAWSRDGEKWTRADFNPILEPGPKGAWSDETVYKSFVLKHQDEYWMFYNAYGSQDQCEQIGLAWSADLRTWRQHPDNPLLRKGDPVRDRDHHIIADPWIMRRGDSWEMYYFAFDGKHARECLATSTDLIHWVKSPFNPIMDVGPPGTYDDIHCHKPCLIVHEGVIYHFVTSCGHQPGGGELRAIGLATSKMLPGVAYRQTAEPARRRPKPTMIANPASTHCIEQGGTLEIRKHPNGGEYGVCVFEDNRQCEEWALFRGDCPAGGVKVTGYVTEAARYCAITGGEYQVTGNDNTPDEQGTCAFKDGKVCDAGRYFDGTCASGD